MMTVASVIVVVLIGFTDTVSSLECNSTSCYNGATCLPSGSDFPPHCICADDYFGDTCQNKSGCVDLNPCQNNGTCGKPFFPSTKETYECQCSQHFFGVNCQYENPCVTNAKTCKNGGYCHHRIDTKVDKAVHVCHCSPQYKGEYCEQERCSISHSHCFASLQRFPIHAISLGLDYQQCINRGNSLVNNHAECSRVIQKQLVNKKDCNCDPLETMYLLAGSSRLFPNPAQTVASHCLAAAYESDVTDASVPKCPQRTVQCFQCLLKFFGPSLEYKCMSDPQANKIIQKTCFEDILKGKLQYENCEFMQTELEILATEYIIRQNDGCAIYDHFLSCDIKYKELQPCGLNYNDLFTKCLTDLLSKDPECAEFSQAQEKINEVLLKLQSSIDQRATCNKLSTFKDQIRSKWSCPANAAWDQVTGVVDSGTRAVQTLVALVTFCNISFLL